MAPHFIMHINSAAELIQGLLTRIDCVHDNDLARSIGVMIYEAPTIRSGWVSESLVDDYGFRCRDCCEEHYNSRQIAGHEIIKVYREGNLSPARLIELLNKFRCVHLVTSAENIRLSPIQNGKDTRDLSWQEQYKLANIVLVEDKGTAPSWFYKRYVICGTMFDNVDKASRALGLVYDEIRKRCSSKAKKWVEWQVLK